MDKQFGFIGLGLIGGSIAKSIRKYIPDACIGAYDSAGENLHMAKADGVLDVAMDTIDERFRDYTMIFLCTPIDLAEESLRKLKPFLRDDCVITDVGSTKAGIHRIAASLGLNEHFIGGHPMAGLEKSGYLNASDLLLENAFYMVTPSYPLNQRNIDRVLAITKTIRTIPYVIDAREHDKVVAGISHLPHIAASSLVNVIRKEDGENHLMHRAAAGGFKDITRIASSAPGMWSQICRQNKAPILAMLERYIEELSAMAEDIRLDRYDAVYDTLDVAGKYRNTFSDLSIGFMQSRKSISVHVADKPGTISVVVAILAASGVSIANLGINHNRETGEGVLGISFYDTDSCTLAADLLRQFNYRVDTF